jgi:hypothetical protein
MEESTEQMSILFSQWLTRCVQGAKEEKSRKRGVFTLPRIQSCWNGVEFLKISHAGQARIADSSSIKAVSFSSCTHNETLSVGDAINV